MNQAIYNEWSRLVRMPFAMNGIMAATLLDRRAPLEGRFIPGAFQSDQGTLHYKLFVPASYTGEPMPLLVMLHGCGQSADDFAQGTNMNAHAERLGCLVLYPQQSHSAGWNGCWNWFAGAHQQRGQGEPAAIAGATRQVMEDYAVAPGQVFVAGMSAGGAMAVVLGNTYPDLYAAVGCHSGLPLGCATDLPSALEAMRHGIARQRADAAPAAAYVPTIVFHGNSDDTVHCSNGESVIRHALAAADRRGAERAGDMPTQAIDEHGESSGRTFSRTRHREHNGAVIAEHWVVHGGAHTWSGGSRRGSHTDRQGPNASEEMLRFFLRRQA